MPHTPATGVRVPLEARHVPPRSPAVTSPPGGTLPAQTRRASGCGTCRAREDPWTTGITTCATDEHRSRRLVPDEAPDPVETRDPARGRRPGAAARGCSPSRLRHCSFSASSGCSGPSARARAASRPRTRSQEPQAHARTIRRAQGRGDEKPLNPVAGGPSVIGDMELLSEKKKLRRPRRRDTRHSGHEHARPADDLGGPADESNPRAARPQRRGRGQIGGGAARARERPTREAARQGGDRSRRTARRTIARPSKASKSSSAPLPSSRSHRRARSPLPRGSDRQRWAGFSGSNRTAAGRGEVPPYAVS